MASELHVDAIKHSGGTSALTIDSSGNLTANANVHYAGGVVQYKREHIVANSGVVTSTSYAKLNSALDVTITPKFATSTLIIHAVAPVYVNANAYPSTFFAFYRDGSVIGEHNQALGGGYVQVNTGQVGGFIPYIYAEDSANNTNSTTFSLYVKSNSAGNNSNFSELSNRWVGVMEVAQ
mgnify:CR=1 FL=1|tara:strand:- start:749 stop:1285 length:537 start_codon:yes stop_codon:yes gene_type:complete